MTKKELTSDELIQRWRQSRCSIVFCNRHFSPDACFLSIYLGDVNTHTNTKLNVSLKASLAPAPSSAVPEVFRYQHERHLNADCKITPDG